MVSEGSTQQVRFDITYAQLASGRHILGEEPAVREPNLRVRIAFSTWCGSAVAGGISASQQNLILVEDKESDVANGEAGHVRRTSVIECTAQWKEASTSQREEVVVVAKLLR
eukprot:535114-Amphidinium_carterae.3